MEPKTTIDHSRLSQERFFLRKSGKGASIRETADLFASQACLIGWPLKRLYSSPLFVAPLLLRGQTTKFPVGVFDTCLSYRQFIFPQQKMTHERKEKS